MSYMPSASIISLRLGNSGLFANDRILSSARQNCDLAMSFSVLSCHTFTIVRAEFSVLCFLLTSLCYQFGTTIFPIMESKQFNSEYEFNDNLFKLTTFPRPIDRMAPFKYNMYFMMTYQRAKGFVGTRGGGEVQKIVFCFPICSIQKIAVLAQK